MKPFAAQRPLCQQIEESMTLATLDAIRTAAFHGTGMVIAINGRVQTIRPEDHPLYPEALRKHPTLLSKPLKPTPP